jgi:hypothetical protein
VSVNDYWCFSVRPLTPNVVYPERLMTTPQPPDGPRQFLGPLAVLSRANEQWTRRDDCRLPFDDLVELTARKPGTSDGCCVSVKPAQAADLQSIIDGLAQSGVMGATIHLEPGIYELPTPLVFTSRHRGLVLASCSGVPVVLRAAKDALSRFGLGMIILEQAAGVTLRGLELQVPVAPLPPGMVDAMRKQPSLAKAEMAGVSIGIHVAGRPVGSTASPIALPRVTIEACLFAFDATQAIFGAGVFGRDNLPNLRVRDCRFAAALKDGARAPLIAGVMIVPVYVPELDLLVAPRLPESTLTENTFTGLSFGMLVAGQIGDVTACGNTVSGGFCGLGLITLPALLRNWDELNTIPPGENASDPGFATVQACHRAFLDNVQVVLGVGLGASVPRPVALAAATQSPAALTLRLTATANRLDVTGSQVAVPSDTSFKSGRSGLMGLSAGVGDITGPAFYLWSAPNPLPSFATITGNTCVNRSNRTPAMMVLMIEQLAITGNLLNNLAKDNTSNTGRYALIVVPGGRISSTDFEVQVNLFAVTGNSMLGRSNLHLWVRKEWEARLSAMKLPIAAWDFFNTEA